MEEFFVVKELEHFFGPLAFDADRRFGLGPVLVSYVTGLLSEMGHRGEIRTSFGVDMYSGMGPERTIILKDVGDRALFFAGFLPERLEKVGISHRYCSDIGSAAYWELSGRFKDKQLGPVFGEMSRRFSDLRHALGDIRSKCSMDAQPWHVRWLRSHLDIDGTVDG